MSEGITLINSFIWIGFFLSLISAVGNLRFKYPMVVSGLILISPILSAVFEKYYRRVIDLICPTDNPTTKNDIRV